MTTPTILCPKCKTRVAIPLSIIERFAARACEDKLANERAALARKARKLDRQIEKGVHKALVSVRQEAKSDAEASMSLVLREREIQLAGLRRQIDELKQRAEQGSQQLQGEAQEIELESSLSRKFPHDDIEPVPNGCLGGDILQRVRDQAGEFSGSILWESKRTKNWSDGWLTKLRQDQRSAKADVAVIVSRALPKDLSSFDLVEGIWVAPPKYALPLAVALRHALICMAGLARSPADRPAVSEKLSRYICGPEFRRRVEAIAECLLAMKEDLHRERRATTRIWAKREAQIEATAEAVAAMCVDLETNGGKSLAGIEHLSAALLEAP